MKKLFFVSLILLSSCTKSKVKGNSGPEAAAGSETGSDYNAKVLPTDQETTEEFRNIFYSYANQKFSKDDVQKLVYLPTPEIMALKGTGSEATERLDSLREEVKAFKPSQLYDYGKTVELQDVADVDSVFASKGPVTIVVIPGIFSEFIETYNFFEFLENNKSASSARFESALAAAQDAALKTDKSFDFESFAEKELPLEELIKTASYDDAQGKPMLQLVVMRMKPFSGESVGSLKENSEVFLRRMDKYFKLVGEPENLYVMGYSRGASVALQMVVDLEEKDYSWETNLRGMISLGGVIYGAALADAAFDEADPLQAIAGRIKELSDSLEIPADDAGTIASLAAATRNSGRWVAAAAEVTASALKLSFDPGLGLEEISPDWIRLDANVRMMKDIAFEKFDLADTAISNYFLNIKKFKWIIDRAFEGIQTLTTASRIEWWKNHKIPTHIKYYSLSGVMPDVSTEAGGVSALAGNPVAFNTKAIDYLALRVSYYELFRVSKNQLTDSQSSVEGSRLVYDINKVLNPNQEPFDSRYMGILGVDHWGMSFPVSTLTQNDERSPFPRSILIQTIANFVARHQ